MNHEEIKEKLYDFHKGELGAAEKKEIRGHLRACRECRVSLNAIKKISSGLKVSLSNPPSSLLDGIMDAAGIKKRPLVLRPSFALTAALLLMITLAGFGVKGILDKKDFDAFLLNSYNTIYVEDHDYSVDLILSDYDEL
jgi:hypothetical protein